MPLNDLTLPDLAELTFNLFALERAGNELQQSGLEPVFDLTPGEPMVITVSARMPYLDAVTEDRLDPATDTASVFVPGAVVGLGGKSFEDYIQELVAKDVADGAVSPEVPNFSTPSTEAAPVQGGAKPVDAPPVAEGPAGGAPMPSVSASSAADMPETIPPAASIPQEAPQPAVAETEDSGGGAEPAAPQPPAASHERTFSGAAVWTPEEDARLVDLVASGMVRLGLGKTAAIRAAAAELGRPEQGTAFRCHHKLKDRIEGYRAELQLQIDLEATPIADAIPAPTEPPEADPKTADGDAAVGGHAPAAVQDEAGPAKAWHQPENIADPVTAYLMTLPDKGGWTLARDHELMELSIAGWHPNEIALQLQVQANQIKPRFDQLTGLYEDGTGKKVRRFNRDDVFAALTKLIQRGA